LNEAPRVHHAARRRGSCLAAHGACAAFLTQEKNTVREMWGLNLKSAKALGLRPPKSSDGLERYSGPIILAGAAQSPLPWAGNSLEAL
jgi:hypothetical protein